MLTVASMPEDGAQNIGRLAECRNLRWRVSIADTFWHTMKKTAATAAVFYGSKRWAAYSTGFCDCTIFMAEVISAETSVMLEGTTNVVAASCATLP